MGMLKEFKGFIMKGNVVDLAVAVIVGAAFGAIISSLVEDVITPMLLSPALKAAHAEDLDKLTWGAVKYGKFLAAIIKFVVIAFVLFVIIKVMKSIQQKEVPPATEPTPTEKLLMEISSKLSK